MGWFGKLFGTDKAVDNLLDKDSGLLVKTGEWIGNFNYTDEEKAENALLVKQWGIKQLEALEPFRVVQRILAFGVTSLWLFVGLNVVGAIWYDNLNKCPPSAPECVSPDITTAMLQFAMSDYVFWPVLAVLSLYFTGGILPKRNQ